MTDAPQFEAFVRNYQDMVFSTAMRLVANAAEAEDISQEVFLRAFEHFSELAGDLRAGGWLKRVAINLSLNHLSRYRARWSFFSELVHRNPAGEETEIEYAAANDVEEEFAVSERRLLVENALRQLPSAQRVPMVLFHLEGMKYEEIAAQLGISLAKVKTDIFRARSAMRKSLSPRLQNDWRPAA
jgi:RNA polymerase sigma-70 factor (ECF subfamily)